MGVVQGGPAGAPRGLHGEQGPRGSGLTDSAAAAAWRSWDCTMGVVVECPVGGVVVVVGLGGSGVVGGVGVGGGGGGGVWVWAHDSLPPCAPVSPPLALETTVWVSMNVGE